MMTEPLRLLYTSVIVRYLVGDDASAQARALALIESESPLGITPTAILEASFALPAGQTVTNLWSGTYTQSGGAVTVKDAGYNGSVPAGGAVSFGFQASDSGTPGTAGNFTLNGAACT